MELQDVTVMVIDCITALRLREAGVFKHRESALFGRQLAPLLSSRLISAVHRSPSACVGDTTSAVFLWEIAFT